jgi:hypothetical protein
MTASQAQLGRLMADLRASFSSGGIGINTCNSTGNNSANNSAISDGGSSSRPPLLPVHLLAGQEDDGRRGSSSNSIVVTEEAGTGSGSLLRQGFAASDAVEWMLQNGHATNTTQAVSESGVIVLVDDLLRRL